MDLDVRDPTTRDGGADLTEPEGVGRTVDRGLSGQ